MKLLPAYRAPEGYRIGQYYAISFGNTLAGWSVAEDGDSPLAHAPRIDHQGASQKMMKDILSWKFLSFTVAIKFYSLVAIAAGILSLVFWRLHASL